MRFIDPEMIAKIKEELERRINSAVGGYDKALELMGGVDLKSKKAIYENLESKHPDVAAKVRPTLIFIEDIAKLEDRELSILIGTIAVDQLATAMWRVPETVRPRIKAQMTERSWMMVEQTMKYGKPSDAKIDKAVEEIISSVWKLIAAARIKNPNIVKEGEEPPMTGPMAAPPPPGNPAQIAAGAAPAAPGGAKPAAPAGAPNAPAGGAK